MGRDYWKYALRQLGWRSGNIDLDMMVWMVDGNDRDRLEDASSFFRHVMEDELMKDVKTVVVLVNKLDMPNCIQVDEVVKELGVKSIRQQPVKVIGMTARKKEGVNEFVEWLKSQD